jgi:hypothetical protein
MANLTLAPEDDESDFSLPQKPSPAPVGLQRFHLCFDPEKVGFGIISPWPGLEETIEAGSDRLKLTDKTQHEKERQ